MKVVFLSDMDYEIQGGEIEFDQEYALGQTQLTVGHNNRVYHLPFSSQAILTSEQARILAQALLEIVGES